MRGSFKPSSRSLARFWKTSDQWSRATRFPASSRYLSNITDSSSLSSPASRRPTHLTTLSVRLHRFPGIINAAKRSFSISSPNAHNHLTPPKPGEELHVTFIDKDGDESTFEVAEGDNLMDIAIDNDVEMEGACGGSCACSTCHVIVVDDAMYDKMSEPDDDENDMLDLAFGLTETSRLGCQVKMSKELDGLRIRLPSMTRNLQASDFSKRNERSD